MKYLYLLTIFSTAFAAVQIQFDQLGVGRPYYKGMNIRAIQPGSLTGYKNHSDWDYAFGRLKNMSNGFNAVRIYSTQDNGINHLDSVYPLALKYDLKLLVGLYLDELPLYNGTDRFDKEFAALKASTQKYKDQKILYQIAGIAVGNEDEYQNRTMPNVLAQQIQLVQQWLKDEMQDGCTPVGHTDTWSALTDPKSKPVSTVLTYRQRC